MSTIILSPEAQTKLASTVKNIMALMAEIDNAQEDIKEQCEQAKEIVDMKPAEIKALAKTIYKDSLDTEREKFETLEGLVELLKGKI